MGKSYLLLLAAIVCEVVGTSALKASDGFTRLLPTLLVAVWYVLAFWLLSLALRTLSVGVSYAIWSGAGTALVTVVGWLLYGQRLDAWALAGVACIICGVLMLTLLSRSSAG